MNIEAVLFDIDGVLVDSERIIADVSVGVFKEFGIDVDPSVYPPLLGAGDRTFIDGIASIYNHPLDFEKTKAKIYEAYEKALSEVGPIEGVREFLDALKKANIKIALASSAPLLKIKMNLKAIGKDESFFDAIVSGDDISNNKPAPEIYLLAGSRVSTPMKNCLVVEDSTNGVSSGFSSGASVLGITSSFKKSELVELGAFNALANFTEITNFTTKEEFNNILDNLKKENELVKYGAIKCREAYSSKVTKEQLIENSKEVAYKTRLNAYAAYSNYQVGAAIVSASSNKIYGGCNVENSSYGAAICAERNAILKMISEEGPTGIKLVSIVSKDTPPAPPCALCLQVLAEFCRADTEFHLYNTDYIEGENGIHQVYKFEELLPHPFVLKK
jgi:cytidine deaminase